MKTRSVPLLPCNPKSLVKCADGTEFRLIPFARMTLFERLCQQGGRFLYSDPTPEELENPYLGEKRTLTGQRCFASAMALFFAHPDLELETPVPPAGTPIDHLSENGEGEKWRLEFEAAGFEQPEFTRWSMEITKVQALRYPSRKEVEEKKAFFEELGSSSETS